MAAADIRSLAPRRNMVHERQRYCECWCPRIAVVHWFPWPWRITRSLNVRSGREHSGPRVTSKPMVVEDLVPEIGSESGDLTLLKLRRSIRLKYAESVR